MTLATLEDTRLGRWVELLAPARQLAEVLAGTEFVPVAMRGNPDAITATILYGDEVQVGPMQALVGIHVVEGRPSPSAELMRALILREGHTFVVHEMTGTRCRVSGLRKGRPDSERVYVEWTADMARAAGLLGRTNWQRYPRAMLMARATGDLARILFPDVIKGLGFVAEDDTNAAQLDTWATQETGADAEAAAPARQPVQRASRPARGSLAQPPQAPEERPAEQPTAPPAPGDLPPTTPPAQEPPIDAEPPPAEPRHRAEPPIDQEPPVAPPAPRPVVDVELQPEPQPQDPQPPSTPLGDGLRRGLHAATRRVLGDNSNAELDRMERLELWSVILGHDVESTNDLNRAEGMTIANWLGRIERGSAVMWRNESGEIRIADNPEPEPRSTQQPPSDWKPKSDPWLVEGEGDAEPQP